MRRHHNLRELDMPLKIVLDLYCPTLTGVGASRPRGLALRHTPGLFFCAEFHA
jgi:hypothetical protein